MMGEPLPPGTQRLEDINNARLLLCPRPTSDPNQPLVSRRKSVQNREKILTVSKRWSKTRKYVHMAILSFYGIMMFAVYVQAPDNYIAAKANRTLQHHRATADVGRPG